MADINWNARPTSSECAADRLRVACATPMPEDETTVQYIGATAQEAGYRIKFLPIREIGWDEGRNLFVDLDGEPMRILFKLYPWEWIMREDFGANIKLSGALYQAFARPGYFDGHYADIGAWMVAK